MLTSAAGDDAEHIAALRQCIVQAEEQQGTHTGNLNGLTLHEAVLRLRLIWSEYAASLPSSATREGVTQCKTAADALQAHTHTVNKQEEEEEKSKEEEQEEKVVQLAARPLPAVQWPLPPVTERARCVAERRAAHAARHARREQRRAELQLGGHHRDSVAARLLRVAAGGGTSLFRTEAAEVANKANEKEGNTDEAVSPAAVTSNNALLLSPRRRPRLHRTRSAERKGSNDRGQLQAAYRTSTHSPRHAPVLSRLTAPRSRSTYASLSDSSSSSLMSSSLTDSTRCSSSPYSISALSSSSWSASHNARTGARSSAAASSSNVTQAPIATPKQGTEASSKKATGAAKPASLAAHERTTSASAAEQCDETPREDIVTPYLFAPTVRLTDLTKLTTEGSTSNSTETNNSSNTNSNNSSMCATCVCFAPDAQDYLVGTQDGLVWLFPLHARGPAMEVTYLGSLYRRARSRGRARRDLATPSPLDRADSARQSTNTKDNNNNNNNTCANRSNTKNSESTAVPLYRNRDALTHSPSPRAAVGQQVAHAGTRSNDGEATGGDESERTDTHTHHNIDHDDDDNNNNNNKTSKREQPVALLGHSAAVTSLAFSDDGSYFVSAAEDCGIILWRTSTRAKLRRLNVHLTPRRVRFMPENSNYLLVVLDQEDDVRLYNTSTGLRVLDAVAEKKQRRAAKKESMRAHKQSTRSGSGLQSASDAGGVHTNNNSNTNSSSSGLTWQSVAEFFHALPPSQQETRRQLALTTHSLAPNNDTTTSNAAPSASPGAHVRGITALAVERCCEPFFFTGDGGGVVSMWCYRAAGAQEDRTLSLPAHAAQSEMSSVSAITSGVRSGASTFTGTMSGGKSSTTRPAHTSRTAEAGTSVVLSALSSQQQQQQPSSSALVPLPYLPQLRRLTSCIVANDGMGCAVGELHVGAMNAMQASALLAVAVSAHEENAGAVRTSRTSTAAGAMQEGAGGHGGLTDRLAQLVSSYWDSATSVITPKPTTDTHGASLAGAVQRKAVPSALLTSLSPVMVVVALPCDTIVVLAVRHDRQTQPQEQQQQRQMRTHHGGSGVLLVSSSSAAWHSAGSASYSLVKLWQVRGLCRLRHIGLGAVAAPEGRDDEDGGGGGLHDVVLACPCEEGFVHLVAPSALNNSTRNSSAAQTAKDKPYEVRTTLAMPCGGECRGLCWSAQGRYLVAVTAEGLVYEWERMYMLHDIAESPLPAMQLHHSTRSEESGGSSGLLLKLPPQPQLLQAQMKTRPCKASMYDAQASEGAVTRTAANSQGTGLVMHTRTDTNATSPSTTETDERPRRGGYCDAAERRLCDLEERGWRASYLAAKAEQEQRRCRAHRVQHTRSTVAWAQAQLPSCNNNNQHRMGSSASSAENDESHVAVSGSEEEEESAAEDEKATIGMRGA